IIRIAALCVLCRYRHKTHWTASPERVGRDLSRYAKDRSERSREELIALS
ncbi:antirestriction protein, partial [Agrobacterium tumefaciens]